MVLLRIMIEFPDDVVMKIVQEYTRESGVRSLEREISAVIRKTTRAIVENTDIKESRKESYCYT